MRVLINEEKGNSPKNRFVEEWVFDYLQGHSLDDRVSEDFVLPKLPSVSDDAFVEILYGITHGKIGAVLAEVTQDENIKYLSFHLEFKNFKGDKISNVIITKG